MCSMKRCEAEEWLTRLSVYGREWFSSPENLLDTFIALAS